MLQRSKLSRIALAVAMSVGLSTAAMANTGQSSSIRGVIEGPTGSPAVGTTITMIHQPSGTVKEVEVNAEGAFTARGLRVGGPYTVMIVSKEFESQVIENVYLEMNQPLNLDTQLNAVQELETITVTGTRDFFSNNGGSSVFGEDQIMKGNTFNRDLKDIVRLNPLAVVSPDGNELSVAGTNPKYNSLTIDGVGVSDTFGLNENGYPAQRPPISLDAVEQISVDYAPFNARAANFTGGNVNVVTKSGTNEFHGSFFYEDTVKSGDAEDKLTNPGVDIPVDTDETTFGVTVGGPIIKDKLFFFASYEEWEEGVLFDYNLNDLSGSGHRVTNEEVDRFIGIMSNVYGLSDSLGGTPPNDMDKKTLVKLDWNISQDHRADLTYSFQDNTAARNYTDSDSTLDMASGLWFQASETTLLTGHLYSDWNDSFSTEASFSYKEYEQASNTAVSWGEINVRTDRGTIVAGQDENRHANHLENEELKFGLHAVYLAGDVEYRFGVEYEDLSNFNIYGRDSAGTWSFDSLDDFENRMPARLEYASAYTGNINDIAYDVDSNKYAAYGEANFELLDGLMMTAGLRYERIGVDGTPRYNESFENTYGYPNTENQDGLDILLPRIGFTYDVNEEMTVRGGVGRYTGGTPLVWIANAYTRDGITNVNAPSSATNAAIADPDNVDFTTVPASVQDSLVAGAGSTNSIDPNFELPNDWRYQLAVDLTFDIPGIGDNFAWSTEFTYVDRKDSAFWVDLSREQIGTAADGRIIWGSVYDDPDRQGNWDLQMTNASDGGRSIIWSTSLYKEWDNGITLSTSYTNQNITEVNPGTSSTGESNFQYEVTENRNIPTVGRAYYEVEHRLVLNLSYEKEFFDGYDTTFNLFFERRSGKPFAWTLGSFRDNDLGDQGEFDDSDIYIPYIPGGADDPIFDFDNGLSYEEIMEIASQAGVAGYAGGYVPKYSGTQPWVTTMDLSINQEIPGFMDGHKATVYLNIDNFANLLNSDWGQVYDLRFPQQILMDWDLNDQGQYVYDERFGGTNTSNFDEFDVEASTWRIKVGVRYTF